MTKATKQRDPNQLELPFKRAEYDEEPDRGIAAVLAVFLGGVAIVVSIVWIIVSMLRAGM